MLQRISTPKPSDSSSRFDTSPKTCSRKQSTSTFESINSTSYCSLSNISNDANDNDNEESISEASSIHSAPLNNSGDQRPFACFFPGCQQRFSRKGDVYRHITKHDSVNDRLIVYTCHICEKTDSYERKDSITRHRSSCEEKVKKPEKGRRRWRKKVIPRLKRHD